MDLELRLREAVKEQDPGQAFTAKVMAGVDGAKVVDIRSRMRRRIMLPGALLVVGAAAAMLALEQPGTESTRLEEVASPPAIAEALRATGEIAAVDNSGFSKQVSIDVTPESPAAIAPVDGSGRITLLVMPVVDRSGATGARSAADAFRAQLVRDFRAMPDLVVMESTGDSAAEGQVDFRLSVSSLEWRRPTPGRVEVISTTGSTSSEGTPYLSEGGPQPMPALGTQYWPVEAKIEEARAAVITGGKPRFATVATFSAINGIRQPDASCSIGGSLLSLIRSGADSIQWLGKTCGNSTAIAGGLAEIMRQRNVPVPVTRQPAVASANAAIAPRPGFVREPLADNLRIYIVLLSLADAVERAASDDRSADDIESRSIRQRFDLDEAELLKLDRYLRVAIRSDRDNQATLQAGICARIAEFHTLDQFGAALNEYSGKTKAHQETLGRDAAMELGAVLFSKISTRAMAQTSRESTGYDFPAMFKAQNRDLQQELDRFCSFGK